jgi:rhamnulokinase
MTPNPAQPHPAPPPTDRRASVAIDLGAESCRVSLLRWSTRGLAEDARGSLQNAQPHVELIHRFANHATETTDGLHWNLSSILNGLDHGLARCAEIATEGVRSIAVDGWAVDYVRLDAAGQPVANPFCYRDERTIAAESTLHERLPAARMRELTGIQLLRINTAYQMCADATHVRDKTWLNLPEFVLFRLGARPVSERTNASHTQMLGLDGQWCSEILSALDCSVAMLPELVDPGTDIGQLQGPLAQLPAFANTRLIAPACHDTASAIAAIPDAGDDWAYISSGTWSLVGTQLRAPNNSPRAREENFTNLIGADRTICFHKNVNGMWLLRQCLEAWHAEGAAIELASLIQQASAIAPPGYTLDVDDPDLLLSGHMPQRINAQLRRRNLPELSVHWQDAPAMASLLFHSLAARYAEVLHSVAAITGKQLRRIYIMGGGSQNDLLNRLTTEATGLPVCKIGTECSTVGNFAVQLATLEKNSLTPISAWASLLARAAI